MAKGHTRHKPYNRHKPLSNIPQGLGGTSVPGTPANGAPPSYNPGVFQNLNAAPQSAATPSAQPNAKPWAGASGQQLATALGAP